jgi:hypothetical protein
LLLLFPHYFFQIFLILSRDESDSRQGLDW